MATIALTTLASCEIETSDNGDFDGFWHLERVDTLATGGTLDLSKKRVFWGVQYKLISVRDVDVDKEFVKEKLNGGQMILRSKTLRLKFKRF